MTQDEWPERAVPLPLNPIQSSGRLVGNLYAKYIHQLLHNSPLTIKITETPTNNVSMSKYYFQQI